MNKLFANYLFLFGLLLRVLCLIVFLPYAASEFYVPFLEVSLTNFSLDPWHQWIVQGGDPLSFPYGYSTWLILLPFTALAKILHLPLYYGYGFSLLLIDFSLLVFLKKLLPKRERLVILAYWLSPIVIFATYIVGLNDLIPIFLLFLSLFFINEKSWKISGICLAASISAKLSMVIALPFFFFYFFNNKPLRLHLYKFIAGFSIGVLILIIPFLFSNEGLFMLINNPRMVDILELKISTGDSSIFIIPLAYLIFLYVIWRLKRLNFSLFQASLGVVFLSIVLMTLSSPGWFVWTIPFLVYYQAISDKTAILLTFSFSVLYLVSVVLSSNFDLPQVSYLNLTIFDLFTLEKGNFLSSLLYTGVVSAGAVLAIRFWREAVSRNLFFRLSRKPFVIGIAGDSGSGKDTLNDAIIDLFGANAVASLSGDDYHFWDRNKPTWQAMTHLNPMANDLERYANDLVSLIDGNDVLTKRYDHDTGLMSHPRKIKSNDFIIASGLHALYLPILRDCYDLSIYLDIDEDLRRYFKIKRDTKHRDRTKQEVLQSFEDRHLDSEKFIKKQRKDADLILSLQSDRMNILDNVDEEFEQNIPLKLSITSKQEFNELSLRRILIGVNGLNVDMNINEKTSDIELIIEGDSKGEDISEAIKILSPNILEFLDLNPRWSDGMLGIMQLIVLSHMNQALTKRFI